MPGFVLPSPSLSCSWFIDSLSRIGLSGDAKQAVSFRYRNEFSNSSVPTQVDEADSEHWTLVGITPFHVDAEEDVAKLSVIRVISGSLSIKVFKRGLAAKEVDSLEMWDFLEDQTSHMVTGYIDTLKLLAQAYSLDLKAGDIGVFNASDPHAGITTKAPRHTEAVFFS